MKTFKDYIYENKLFEEQCDKYLVDINSNNHEYYEIDEGIIDWFKNLFKKTGSFLEKWVKRGGKKIQASENSGTFKITDKKTSKLNINSINDKFKSEFKDVEKAYKKLTKKDMPKYFRPPMGKYSKNSLIHTKELGYKTIFWSFAYKDWLINEQPSEEYAINKILDGVHPGAIILLHAVSDTNTKILEEVLLKLQKEGYEFKSLDDLK